jgi:hypothetical protein
MKSKPGTLRLTRKCVAPMTRRLMSRNGTWWFDLNLAATGAGCFTKQDVLEMVMTDTLPPDHIGQRVAMTQSGRIVNVR